MIGNVLPQRVIAYIISYVILHVILYIIPHVIPDSLTFRVEWSLEGVVRFLIVLDPILCHLVGPLILRCEVDEPKEM